MNTPRVTSAELADLVRRASLREMIVEDVVELLARHGAFDEYLPSGTVRSSVVRGVRGHADVEIRDRDNSGLLGAEVKINSQENWGHYGSSVHRSQFEVMAEKVQVLIIVTKARRAPALRARVLSARILTLDDLAGLVERAGLEVSDLAKVSFGAA